jgi:hypothetical protein
MRTSKRKQKHKYNHHWIWKSKERDFRPITTRLIACNTRHVSANLYSLGK